MTTKMRAIERSGTWSISESATESWSGESSFCNDRARCYSGTSEFIQRAILNDLLTDLFDGLHRLNPGADLATIAEELNDALQPFRHHHEDRTSIVRRLTDALLTGGSR